MTEDRGQRARSERFRRIAERRTNQVLNYLRLLGNTANRSTYSYNNDQVEKIFSTIEKRLIETRARFKNASNEGSFHL